MKFKSRKDAFFLSISLGFIAFICTLISYHIFTEGMLSKQFIMGDIILLLVVGFLLWLSFGTAYELTNTHLKYKSGPFKGLIALKSIKEITVGRSLWAGFKPATARNGLIIKYDIYDEIYISPKTNERFIEKILELDQDIKIIYNK